MTWAVIRHFQVHLERLIRHDAFLSIHLIERL